LGGATDETRSAGLDGRHVVVVTSSCPASVTTVKRLNRVDQQRLRVTHN